MSNDAKPYPKSKQLARGERRYRRKLASTSQWQRIIDAKRGACRICSNGNAGICFHHLVPRDFGGDDVPDNIVPLCPDCHTLVTELDPAACLKLVSRLTDAEYAYAIQKMGENVFERVYRIRYDRLPMLEAE